MNMHSAAQVGLGARVRLQPEGSSFQCAPGQTLLAAALSAGIDLPYECASGSCGSCRARLLEGEVSALWSEATGLSERDKRKGDRILCCQSVAHGDCVIQIQPGGSAVPAPPARLQARVRSLRALNDDVMHLVLQAELEVDRAVHFFPGQFMLFDWPGAVGRRAYSMANLSNPAGQLDFLIKRKPGGLASGHLFEKLKCGDALQLEGPYGRAWLREDSERDVVLVAGGSGLAPIWSIAQRAMAVWPQKRLRLLFGVNRASELFWMDEIEQARQMRLKQPQLDVCTVLMHSSPQDPPGCRYGNVVEVMNQTPGDFGGCDLYMAGPPGLIDSVMREFVATGRAQADRVFFDRFC
jgi:NAD(P)H-flavin reductase/ferredoxin